MIFDTTNLNWKIANKTKQIQAKHASAITEKRISQLILIKTLEAKEQLDPDAMICIGILGEIWQQSPKRLFQKYSVIDVDSNGWLICEPKPSLFVECFKVETKSGPLAEFEIIAKFGEKTIVDGKEILLQYGKAGDFICRDPMDINDQWIVKNDIFNSTYEFENE